MSNPAIVVISGFEAHEEAPLSRRLATYYAMPLFNTDTIFEAVRQSYPGRDDSFDCGKVALAVLCALCRVQLAVGLTAIVDSPTGCPEVWQGLSGVCDESGAKLLPIVSDDSGAAFLLSQNLPHRKIDASQDEDSIMSEAVTIIDTMLDMWESVPCGAPEE